MRYIRIVAVLALLAVVVMGVRNVAAQSSAVSIQDFKFEPATITVAVGTTVNWKNDGAAPHTVTAADGSWTSGTLDAGGTYSQTFSAAGEFMYYCKFHGAATGTGMAAKVVVTAAQAQPTAAPTQAAPAGPKPSITVGDQTAAGGKIMVSNVVAAQDGWVVVHKTGPDGKLLLTPIIGQTQVKTGSTDNVEIMLTEAVKAGDTLYPMLHIDEGVKGTYEFPGGPDTPVQVDGNVVVKAIKVTAAASSGNPSITVGDQSAAGGKIMVSNVVAAQDGWVVVHKTGPDGKLLLTPIIGQTQVKAGSTDNVEIMLTEAVKAGDTLYPMLHIDEGVKGTYEFPGGPDTPVQVDGNVVVKAIKVTGAPAAMPGTGSAGSVSLWLVVGALGLMTVGGLLIKRRRVA